MRSPKEIAVLVGIGLAILAGGVAIGRYTAPVDIEYRETKTVLEKATTVINQQIDTEALLKQMQDIIQKENIKQKNNVKKTKETIKAPDGTVTTRETETDLTETDKNSETKTHTDTATSTNTTINLKILDEKLKLEEQLKEEIRKGKRANWSAGLQTGYLLPSLFGTEPGFNILPVRGLFVGGSVSRRVVDVPFVGPLWLGVFGNNLGAVGVDLRVEFK